MRICVIGDELAAGTGDPRGQGWVGRAVARSEWPEPPVVMTLAVPGETTHALSQRWEAEVMGRLEAGGENRLVVVLGAADVPAGVSTPRSRLNLANIVDRALTLRIPTLMIGPPPLAGVDSQQLRTLSRAAGEVCSRRHLPFVDTFQALATHDQWIEDMAASPARGASGAVLPGQAGYALVAWLVLHEGWYPFTGSDPRA